MSTQSNKITGEAKSFHWMEIGRNVTNLSYSHQDGRGVIISTFAGEKTKIHGIGLTKETTTMREFLTEFIIAESWHQDLKFSITAEGDTHSLTMSNISPMDLLWNLRLWSVCPQDLLVWDFNN